MEPLIGVGPINKVGLLPRRGATCDHRGPPAAAPRTRTRAGRGTALTLTPTLTLTLALALTLTLTLTLHPPAVIVGRRLQLLTHARELAEVLPPERLHYAKDQVLFEAEQWRRQRGADCGRYGAAPAQAVSRSPVHCDRGAQTQDQERERQRWQGLCRREWQRRLLATPMAIHRSRVPIDAGCDRRAVSRASWSVCDHALPAM